MVGCGVNFEKEKHQLEASTTPDEEAKFGHDLTRILDMHELAGV